MPSEHPPVSGPDKAEFIRHWELVYGVHEDHYRDLDPEARLGITWPQPYSFRKPATDETGQRVWHQVTGTSMPTEHVSMFSPEQLWDVSLRAMETHGLAYIGYVPRRGTIIEDEFRGRKNRGREADLLDIPEIIADFDTLDGSHKETNLPTGDQVLTWLAQCPAGRPTFTVRTGGGYHAHWCLAEPLPLPEARPLTERVAGWIEHLSQTHGVHAGDEKVTRNPAILFRMAGTVHGKPGPNTNRRVQIVEESGLRYVPDDFGRLPMSMAKTLADAASRDRALLRKTQGIPTSPEMTPWRRVDLAIPVSEVLEKVFFMRRHGSGLTSPTHWRANDGVYGADAAHVTLYQDSDGVERFTAHGQRTASNLGVPAGKGSFSTFSLLLDRFCEGDTRMAAAVAKRFLATDPNGLFIWMDERADHPMGVR